MCNLSTGVYSKGYDSGYDSGLSTEKRYQAAGKKIEIALIKSRFPKGNLERVTLFVQQR